MSLMSNATPEPAKEGATPDPKGDASASGQPPTGTTSDAPPSGLPQSEAAVEKNGKAQPTKAQADFEAKLEELAALDLSVKQQAREIAKAKAQLDRYTPIDDHLTKGELRAAAKKFFGERYTADLLLELAEDFAPEEISVEERVKRTLEAERKATEEADKKKADEKAATEKAAVETETKAYLTATADHLRKNKERYPLICAWDDDEDISHETIIDKTWRAHYGRTGEVLDPDKVLDLVEAAHLARIKKTSFGPRDAAELSFEEHAGVAPAREPPRAAPPTANGRTRSGVEEAYAALEAYENEQRQRALLSYGR